MRDSEARKILADLYRQAHHAAPQRSNLVTVEGEDGAVRGAVLEVAEQSLCLTDQPSSVAPIEWSALDPEGYIRQHGAGTSEEARTVAGAWLDTVLPHNATPTPGPAELRAMYTLDE